MSEPALSPLDPPRSVVLAYAEMGVCNPLSLETFDRVLSQARLPRDSRALDLGCGNATLSIRLAQRFGLEVEALERSPAVCAIARRRIVAASADRVWLHQAASTDYLPGREPFDLIVAIGASAVVSAPPEPTRVLCALRPHVRPGGWLLWGDPFLRREPSPQLLALMGPYAAYLSDAGNVAAGEGAGFDCFYAAASTEQDWDDYSWTMHAVVERWLAAHQDDPDAEQIRLRARLTRTAYLMEGRETLGFGLYLFRAG